MYRTMEKVIMGNWPEKVKVVFELSVLNARTCNTLGINDFNMATILILNALVLTFRIKIVIKPC